MAEHPKQIHAEPEIIPLQDGELLFFHDLFPQQEAERLSDTLTRDLPWRQDQLRFGNRQIPIPRLQSWHGEAHCKYSYSGLALPPLPLTAELVRLRDVAMVLTGAPLNCVLCNLYRDETDSVGWHADDEKELGPNPTIASFSFGETRRFQLRRTRERGRSTSLDLPHNSLLVMRGSLQHHWQHQIPKSKTPKTPRLNLTFRYIAAQ